MANTPIKLTHPVALADFNSYVKTSKENGDLETEFDSLSPPNQRLNSWEVAKIPGNLEKHRYHKHPDILLTYDHTRVVLDALTDNNNSDFFPANWVDGFIRPKRYIVTQCPTSKTAKDFYRMIWQYKVQQIVNLASPRDMESGKGFKYYPETETSNFGEIQVTLVNKEISVDVITRRYELRKGDDTRILSHFHFQSWPDLETPDDPEQILRLIKKYRSDELYGLDKPLVVHCMAGVGRSGTFILTDSMYDMSAEGENLDFLAHLWKIRNQRISMVEKPKQYIYAHAVIAAHLTTVIAV